VECEEYAARCGFRPVRVRSLGMAELVRTKKGWPGNGQQFCTAHLKGLPFLQWIDDADPEAEWVVMVGKRRAESRARANTPEFIPDSEHHGGRVLWHPLFQHTDSDRDALLYRAGFAPLPHRSLECNPCVNANRQDFLRLRPEEADKVSRLEVEIGKPMFRPKRFNAVGIYGVLMWAHHGKDHSEDVVDESGCSAVFGCGL
jgi:hypothetical protein